MNIVYTAILGPCDSLKPAPVGADRCVCFTDDETHISNPKGWEIALWQSTSWQERDARREAWRLRCVPHDLFEFYDQVVWIDASFTLTDLPRLLRDADGHDLSGLRHHTRTSCYEEGAEVVRVGQADGVIVSEQLQSYRRVGFRPAMLTISCILVRTHTLHVRNFNCLWDREIRAFAGDNTQLSLDYCAWKSGLSVHHLSGVRRDNPYAQHDHADHKRRRQPYR
jgi:hypothetical protein